jgi:hypothetical protein
MRFRTSPVRAPWSGGSFAIPLLIVIASGLLVLVLLKEGVITPARLRAHKDPIDAAATLVSTALLVCGAGVAYVRFFKGRLLHPKLDLAVTAAAVPSGGGCAYAVEVEITNKGAVTVWDYTLALHAQVLGEQQLVNCTRWLRDDLSEVGAGGARSVDVGETAYAHAVVELRPRGKPVTFRAILHSRDGIVWARSVTAAGCAGPAGAPVFPARAARSTELL